MRDVPCCTPTCVPVQLVCVRVSLPLCLWVSLVFVPGGPQPLVLPLYVLRVFCRAHKWPGTNPVRSSPSITADGTLLVHVWSLGNLLALDASTGANKWAFTT